MRRAALLAVFAQERDLAAIEADPAKLDAFMQQYQDIADRLEEAHRQRKLSAYEVALLERSTDAVIQSLDAKMPNIRRGVQNIMAGDVLRFDIDDIRDEGRKEGFTEAQIGNIKRMLHNGVKEEFIAQMLDVPLKQVRSIQAKRRPRQA